MLERVTIRTVAASVRVLPAELLTTGKVDFEQDRLAHVTPTPEDFLLGFERGVSTLGQQMLFQNELDQIVALARDNGAASDPVIRQRIAQAHIGLKIMRVNALRMLEHEGADLNREALISKLYWSNWHRDLGKLAMDILGPEAEIIEAAPYELTRMQKWYLFARADTIYAGSNQIQRNIIAQRLLGLPRS